MKKFITILCTTLLLAVTGCQHEDIWDKLKDHEQRLEQLEELCRELNSNISALQTILTAIQQNDYVTEVMKIVEDGVEVGYSITFAKGGTVNIYHGTDGADGSVPNIGVKKASDGEYYWTSDDQWITDENGNRIAVDAQDETADGKYMTPQFRVVEGEWFISYDNGNTWKPLGRIEEELTKQKVIFEAIVQQGDYYAFYLSDGTKILVPMFDHTDVESSQYSGKVISILGDSISTLKGSIPSGNSYYYPKFDVQAVGDTWWGMLIDYMDARLGVNNSWSGSMVSNTSETNSGNMGPDRCMPALARIESLGDNGTPDIILFYGGTNDVYHKIPLGTFDKNSLHTTVDLERIIWDNFADAYKDAIMRMQHYYPYAQIVCISPTYSNITEDYIKNLDSYINVIKDISDYFGTQFVDLRKCGITLESSDPVYDLMGDVTHPDVKGMEMIAKYVYRQICNSIQYEEIENEKEETSEVDLFVFAGQSNMMGAAYLPPEEDVLVECAYEYKYAPILKGADKGEFVYAQHPAGDWHYIDPAVAYGPDYLDVETGKSKLAKYPTNTYFLPASRDYEKGFSAQSEYLHYPGVSMPPFFAKYYSEMGNKCVYAHIAKGACNILHYFTEDTMEEYNRLLAEYNDAHSTSYSAITSSNLSGAGDAFDAKYTAMIRDYADFAPQNTIANKCFVWLQGESDVHNYAVYKLRLQALWSHLQGLGFTHFFILRVGYWGSPSVINEIKAQTDFCDENENCYIVSRAPSLIPFPGATTSDWWITDPSPEYDDCRDSYIASTSNNHFNEKAHKIFARKAAENIDRILHMGLPPVLEEENLQGMSD